MNSKRRFYMKKIVFALIVVLLLGSFVACNGEADFLLWGDSSSESGDNSRTLKLRLNTSELRPVSFADGDRQALEKSFTVPDSVTTWADLAEAEFEVEVYSFEEGYEEDNPHKMYCRIYEYNPDVIQFESPTASLYLEVCINNEPVSKEDAIDFSIVYSVGLDD